MKLKFYFLPFSLLLLTGSVSIAQSLDNAGEYLHYVGEQYSAISNDMMSYTSAASHGKSARKVEKRRVELMQTIKEAEYNMKKLKPFKGDASLRDTVASYFHLTGLVLNQDYSKIVDMEEVAEQSYDKMEAYMLAKEKAGDKLHEAFEKAQKQYNTFANNNNIRLIEESSKLSKKLDQTNKVMKYHDVVYLIFFKSYKDEAYLMDAINRSDISAIEQTKNSLQTSATEGLKKMVSVGGFEMDKSLKVACEKLLEFYKYESSDKTTEQTDFLLKKEKFDKAKKAMDAKRANERTQSDVDNYNKLVKEYNDSVNKSNQLTSDLNKRRANALDAWNKASADFLDNHVPKHK